MTLPQLPPLLSLQALEQGLDPFMVAVKSVRAGESGAGDFFWSTCSRRLELAVVLEPENSLEASLPALLLSMVAFGDALGAVAPPVVAVHFRWPDRIEVNGGFVGGFRIAAAEVDGGDNIPDWLVIGLEVAVQFDPDDNAPGLRIDTTTLYDEGCGEVTVEGLGESFARHFLAWLNRWQEEGFEPVRQAWRARWKPDDASDDGQPTDIDLHGNLLRLNAEPVPLSVALQGPTWSVDVKGA